MTSNSTSDRTLRLIHAQRKLLHHMRQHPNLEIFNAIDESYYMQKIVELEILIEKIAEIRQRLLTLEAMLTQEYPCAFSRWSNDARWLNRWKIQDRKRDSTMTNDNHLVRNQNTIPLDSPRPSGFHDEA